MIMIMKRHEQTYFLLRFLRAVEVYKVPICSIPFPTVWKPLNSAEGAQSLVDACRVRVAIIRCRLRLPRLASKKEREAPASGKISWGGGIAGAGVGMRMGFRRDKDDLDSRCLRRYCRR